MKSKVAKWLSALAAVLTVGQAAHSIIATYSAYLVNEPALAYDKNYQLDLNAYSINTFSAQAVYSSATIASASFTDGTESTGTITVASPTALSSASATNTLTVASNSGLAAVKGTNQLYITNNASGALLGAGFFLNGRQYINGVDWTRKAVSSNTAISMAAAVNANSSQVTAVAAYTSGTTSTVTFTCTSAGTYCNSYTLRSSTPTALGVKGATFSGGLQSTYFFLGEIIASNGSDWYASNVASNTAIALKNYLNTNSTKFGVTASTTAATVVTLTCRVPGTMCNSYTLSSSSPSILTVGGATFSGGLNNAVVSVNGTTLRQGNDWLVGASSTTAATAIKNAINANANLSPWVSAVAGSAGSATAGIVTLTAAKVGAFTNFTLAVSTPALTLSNPTMTGGTTSAYTKGSGNITLTAHNFSLALPVLYTAGAVAIAPLVNQTTYYAVPVDANTTRLSDTSTGAVAGIYAVFTSSSVQTSAHTYTLAPLSFVAAANTGFKWQGSNDASTWFDLSLSTVSWNGGGGVSGSASWDNATTGYRYIRAKVVGPSKGGLNLAVYVNGKN